MAAQRLSTQELAALAAQVIQQAQAQAQLPKHLTEKELAARWRVDVQIVAAKRKAGDGPPYLRLADSATKQTIRYPLAGVEAWEREHLVQPGAA